jgi:hypothetical protein
VIREGLGRVVGIADRSRIPRSTVKLPDKRKVYGGNSRRARPFDLGCYKIRVLGACENLLAVSRAVGGFLIAGFTNDFIRGTMGGRS